MARAQRTPSPEQKLFVKNVPQEWVDRITALYEAYRPLYTKNLYPNGRITTLMVELPSIACAENALRDTNGARIGNSILNVERYKTQSTVARREARDSEGVLGREPTKAVTTSHFDEDRDGNYTGEVSSVETEAEGGSASITDSNNTKRDKWQSWANVASGAKRAPSPTPSAELSARKSHATAVFTRPSKNAKEESTANHLPSVNGTGPKSRASLPLKGTFTSPSKTPSKPAPVTQVLDPNRSPVIARTPASNLPVSQSAAQRPRINGGPSDAQALATQQNSASVHVTNSHSNGTPAVAKVHNQQSQAQDVPQQPRTALAMPINSTSFVQQQHCRGCAFCQMRLDLIERQQKSRKVASDDLEGA